MRTSFLPACLLLVLFLLPRAALSQPEAIADHDEVTRLGLLLQDPNPDVRLQAIKALGGKYDDRASEWLTRALQEPDPRLRGAAAAGLLYKGYQPAVPLLIKLLGDPEETVRAPAARALGMHRGWQAVEPLLNALKDPAPAVRAGALFGLGNIHAGWALDAMFEMLADPSPTVRGAAVRALSDLSQPQNWSTGSAAQPRAFTGDEIQALQARVKTSLQQLLKDEHPDARANAVIALAKFSNASISPELLEAVKHPDPAIRREALQSMGQNALQQNPQLLETFLAALKEEKDAEVRCALVWNLGVLQNRRATEPLVAALADQEPKVQARAIWALGNIGDPAAGNAIMPFLLDGNKELRAQAALALGRLGDRQAVNPLLRALEDEDKWVRQYAVMSLGQLKDPRAVKPLIEVLINADGDLLNESVSALGMIGDPAAIDPLLMLVDHRPAARATILFWLGRFDDPRVVPPLIAAFQDPDTGVRRMAITNLRRILPFCTTEQVQAVLQDKDVNIRGAAMEQLAMVADPSRFVDLLLAGLKDAEAGVRRSAILGLQRCRDPKAVEPLMTVIKNDPDPENRAQAVQAILQRDVFNNAELILTLLQYPDVDVRKSVLSACGDCSDPRVTRLIIAAMQDKNPEIRSLAAQCFINNPLPQALEPLLALLADPDQNVRREAAYALHQYRDERMIGPLLAALQDPYDMVRTYAVQSLAWCRTPAVTEGLAPLLQDPDPQVKRNAAIELAARNDPRAIEPLLAMLKDGNSYAAYALGRYTDPKVEDMLVEELRRTVTADDLNWLLSINHRGLAILASRYGKVPLTVSIVSALQQKGMPAGMPALAEMLHDEQPVRRAAAVAVLAQYRDARTVPDLTAALADTDPLVRRAALRGFRLLADMHNVPLIRPLLRDPDAAVRAEAVLALGDLQDTRVMNQLRPLLLDPDADIRYVAAYAFGRIGDARGVLPLLEALPKAPDAGVRRQVICALGFAGDVRAGQLLLPYLKDADPQTVAAAALALGQLKDHRAVEPLLKICEIPTLSRENWTSPPPISGEIRGLGLGPDDVPYQETNPQVAAIIALGELADPRAIDGLTVQLNGENERAITAAAKALAKMGEPRAAEAVLSALAEKRPYDVVEYTRIMAENATPALIGDFLNDLRNPAAKRRELAARFVELLAGGHAERANLLPVYTMGRKEARAVAPLTTLLQDKDPQVRSSALHALSALQVPVTLGDVTPLLAAADAYTCNTALMAVLKDHQGREIPGVTALLKHERNEVRTAAIMALGQPQAAWAADALAPLLQDADADIRRRAAEALGYLGDARALDPLLALLHAPALPQRYGSVQLYSALAHIRDPRALQALIEALPAADPVNQRWIYEMLVRSKDPAVVEVFAKALGAPDTPAWHQALQALYTWTYGISLQPMEVPEVLKDRRVLSALLAALQDPRPTSPPIPGVTSYGDDTSPARKAAFILSQLNNRDAVEPLLLLLDTGDPVSRMATADALGKLQDPRAVESLIATLDHFGKDGRFYAARALANITGQDFGEDAAKWQAWWAGQGK